MTTPTPAEVGHGIKEPTVVEIDDGFRGQLISADHADYDIARGLTGARDEFHLAAIVQNLKTLASHIWRPPLSEPAACS